MSRGLPELSLSTESLFECLGEGAFLHDASGTLLDVNERAVNYLGYETRESLIDDIRVWDLEREFTRDELCSLWARMTPGETMSFAGFHRGRNDSSFPVENRLHCFEHRGEKLFLLLSRDQTPQVKQEQQLKDRTRRFRTLYELSPVGLWEADWSAVFTYLEELTDQGVKEVRDHLESHPEDLREAVGQIQVLNVNEALVSLLEAPDKQTLIDKFERMVPEDGYEILLEDLMDLWNRRETRRREIPLRTFQGTEKTILRKSKLIPGHEDHWTRIFVSYQDVTEQRDLRRKLKEQTELLNAINDQMPGVSFRFLRQGPRDYRFQYLSEGVEELAGVDRKAVLDDFKHAVRAIHPEDRDRVLDAIEHSAETLTDFHQEVRFERSDGSVSWALFSSRPEKRDDGSICWNGIALDITDRIQAEKQLEQSLEEKQTLFDEMHHRVKNNLQIITSMLGLKSNDLDDPEARELIQTLRRRIESMALVHEILHKSRDWKSIPVKQYLVRVVETLRDFFDSSPVELDLRITEDADLPTNRTIPLALVLNELLTNSFKYAVQQEESSHTVTVVLESAGEDQYRLIVSDEGPGLPEEIDPAEADSMGLNLVHNLVVNQLEGSYSVDREDGTRFRIEFESEPTRS